jgi:lysozyme family protein
MAEFLPALMKTLAHEGGLSMNRKDPGNWYNGELIGTNYGISGAVARAYGYTGPMSDLPQETAAAIYQQEYWPGLENLDYQEVSNKAFDIFANFGRGNGTRILQEAANTLLDQPISVDGGFGQETLDAINSLDPNAYLRALAEEQAAWYRADVAKHPEKAGFLAGWIARANDVESVIVRAAGEAATATGEAITQNPATSIILVLLIGAAALYFLGAKGRA